MAKFSKTFPIVGIGSSAGGLEALISFFKALPVDSGMAFVVVPHLAKDMKSSMKEIIENQTKIPVYEVNVERIIEPNNIYVITPGKDLVIEQKKLIPKPQDLLAGIKHPIDRFFRSLAFEAKERAACIIFSGTGTEGTLGLKEIKGQNGVVFVQDPLSAKYRGMPNSALGTGLVDFKLSPENMPAKLIEYMGNVEKNLLGNLSFESSNIEKELGEILEVIKDTTGHDFSKYKQNTLVRRIQRRMSLSNFLDIKKYLEFLKIERFEQKTLLKEFLISVTSFFRDAEAFEVLKKDYLPDLFKKISENNPLRVWVPGCSTGEEAFSLAMICKEYMDENKKKYAVQIYATDLDADGIDFARKGVYPDTIAEDVSEKRLNKFFEKSENFYNVKKSIREMIVFASHNVTSNPPFSNLDLVSCRNLLIYFGNDLQRRIFGIFHYSLKENGILMLGTSEGVWKISDLFEISNKKWKILNKKTGPSNINFLPAFPIYSGNLAEVRKKEELDINKAIRFFKEELLNIFSPPSLLIREGGEVLYIQGRTGKYLEPAPGKTEMNNVFEMPREGLQLKLNRLVSRALEEKKEIIEEIDVKTNGGIQKIHLVIIPHFLPHPLKGLLSISFKELSSHDIEKSEKKLEHKEESSRDQIEQELAFTRNNLQTAIQELEMSNEELKSMNEELQSMNEELQSSNEELQTSQEELRSLNEEFSIANNELQIKMDELTEANNDLNNLFKNANIGVIFLDKNLLIRRFTPQAKELLNLIDSDVHRPFKNIATNLEGGYPLKDAEEALKKSIYIEKEVQDENGVWYLMRTLPYKIQDDVVDGVIITFIDISLKKKADEVLKNDKERLQRLVEEKTSEINEAKTYYENIINTIRDFILVLDSNLNIVSANNSFYKTFETDKNKVIDKKINEIYDGKLVNDELLQLLQQMVMSKEKTIENFELALDRWEETKKAFLINARELIKKDEKSKRILLFIEDITEKKKIDELKNMRKTRLSDLGALSASVAHELRNPLAAINVAAYNLKKGNNSPETTKKLEKIANKVKEASIIIDNLLDFSRLKSPEFEDIQINQLLEQSLSSVESGNPDKKITIKRNLDETKELSISADPVQIGNIFKNIFLNSYQAVISKEGLLEVSSSLKGNYIEISIKDNGVGIDEENL